MYDIIKTIYTHIWYNSKYTYMDILEFKMYKHSQKQQYKNTIKNKSPLNLVLSMLVNTDN